MRGMKWQLGVLGTISAFAFRHRETKKNLCRGGRFSIMITYVNSSLPFLITHYVKTQYLTVQPIPVTIRTTRFNIQQFHILIT